MKKNILITGAAGLIGSNLSHWLIKNTEYNVIGVDDLSGGDIDNIPEHERFTLFEFSVNDYKKLDEIFNLFKPQYVYHMAAYAAENLSPFIRIFNYQNNLVATASVVNCCIKHDVERLIFTSSMSVYGHGNPPFNEFHIPHPNDPYANAKFACENDIRLAGEQHHLDWCIVRPYNVYGKYQNLNDKYRNVIGIWMHQHLNVEPITIFGDGEQIRNFTCVDDIMQPLYIAATKADCSKQIINLGSSKSYTINEAAKIFQEIVGEVQIKHLPQRHEVKAAFCDNQKAKWLLYFRDDTGLYFGIEQMWEWAKTKSVKSYQAAPPYEITNGMYETWKK